MADEGAYAGLESIEQEVDRQSVKNSPELFPHVPYEPPELMLHDADDLGRAYIMGSIEDMNEIMKMLLELHKERR